MQTVRFFEDRGGRHGERRPLLGIATYDGSWDCDGGRREAVRVATPEDLRDYSAAYQEYVRILQDRGEWPPGENGGEDQATG